MGMGAMLSSQNIRSGEFDPIETLLKCKQAIKQLNEELEHSRQEKAILRNENMALSASLNDNETGLKDKLTQMMDKEQILRRDLANAEERMRRVEDEKGPSEVLKVKMADQIESLNNRLLSLTTDRTKFERQITEMKGEVEATKTEMSAAVREKENMERDLNNEQKKLQDFYEKETLRMCW